MKITHALALLLLFVSGQLQAQVYKTDIKNYYKTKAGDVYIDYTYGERNRGISYRVIGITVNNADRYYFSVLGNMRYKDNMKVLVDGSSVGALYPMRNGWQITGEDMGAVALTAGRHELRIVGNDNTVPMAEEIMLTLTPGSGFRTQPAAQQFLQKMKQLEEAPVMTAAGNADDAASKVLPNPEGLYNHAIDTAFVYSHFSWVYVEAGNHTFTTSGSTISRILTIFNTSNFVQSWSNANSGPGGESSISITVAGPTYLACMLRPTTSGTSGTTNILQNGATIVTNAPIAGRSYAMSSLKGGNLNFFTCRKTAGDTRMLVSRSLASSARAYNDDYATAGDWSWGTHSRIKQNFTGDSVQYAFVCAYSPTTTGICDIYLGNENSNVYAANYPEFPLLKPDDAIKAANSSGYYNCISWSGGVTSFWAWPPSDYSTYSCTGSYGDVTCFDNFYANSPARYPGAWNFTRSGATVSNAVVDLWKLNTSYTHASVQKPGNNHPHGYDWESKPGGLTRTFHPRNALTNNSWGYGSVTNYYRATGTYARVAGATKSFETDVDAVKAGVAIFDKGQLTMEAQEKLRRLAGKADAAFARQFEELYTAWDATKVANALYSDPAMYCKNPEFEALAALAKKNPFNTLVLVMDKFVNNNDHPIGVLMLTLTKEKYGHLLTEVKNERLAKPNDEAGRYRIHGDHDNGVLYVEKILKLLEATTDVKPAVAPVTITASPNPVKDRLYVTITLAANSRVMVQATSAQTRRSQVMQAEKVMQAGTYQFSLPAAGFAGNTGDIITVQVVVDGVVNTVKVLVG